MGFSRKWARGRRATGGQAGKRTVVFTAALPGADARDVREGVVEVPPERMEELTRAFEAAGDHAPGDDCPICALQRRWEREDEERGRAGA